jgi:DNA-directed RNA polymerase specialized sigma24 family protein
VAARPKSAQRVEIVARSSPSCLHPASSFVVEDKEVKESVVPVPTSALRTAEWDLAYRAHGQALLRYLRRLSPTQETAEELLQETFTRAMRTQGPTPSSNDIRPWLYRIATNIAIDQSRRARRFVRPARPSAEFCGAANTLHDDSESRRLRR